MKKSTNTGKILRAIRHHYNFTQVEFSTVIEVSQGALSKLEANQLELSADQWVNFCIKFSLDPNCLITGLIQVLPRIPQKNQDSKSSKALNKYIENPSACVRLLYPLILLMQKTLGLKYYSEFLKTHGLNDEYFCVLSNPINLKLMKLFFNDLYKKGKIQSSTLSDFISQLKFQDFYPSAQTILDQSLSTEEKYLKIFNLFKEYFDHEFTFNSTKQKSTICSIKLELDNTDSDDLYSKFMLDYVRFFINQFNEQFSSGRWNFLLQKEKHSWVLARD